MRGRFGAAGAGEIVCPLRLSERFWPAAQLHR